MKQWLKEEIVQFDKLIEAVGSLDQVARIAARLDQVAFVEHHGKAKCDAMWAHLEAGGAKEDGPIVEVPNA